MSTDASVPVRALAAAAPVRLESVEVRYIALTLVRPFETSFGRMDARVIPLVRMVADGVEGWGEIVADDLPLFSADTIAGAQHVLAEAFIPALLGRPLSSVQDVAAALRRFKGHAMAKAGLELAFMDLAARTRGVSISEAIGGTRARVPVGVSLGIEKDVPTLVEQVLRHVAQGYQRIKLKIKPGWDVDVVRTVREAYPTGLLSVDANTAYTLADADHLRALDAFDLLMIEQPLQHDDLVDHAALQKLLRTDICLDESIVHARAAAHALALGSCRLVNIKIGRVGGYTEALGIHDTCQAHGAPVWCGGMLECGIGRAHNLALASLPNFSLPGDISASKRYWTRDVTTPFEVAADGTVGVPTGPGIGVAIDMDFIDDITTARHEYR
ncbi:o-succinylbenzoate synthase [Luteitalea sp. TBR-22]|uniref:o-succinylbenzoate synthase n=1 Tax=Luteitalea sp. TBR-22 TaxID=2802971 RepID=UPI001AF381DC|nr:o-succinylbenzoate synthase [Luteitalea sp. TBR-22]BCS32005.1 o-succinylbenzoate synthase [Luteitalea sp. TBR-22]